MTPLALETIPSALTSKYSDELAVAPKAFAKVIPKPAPPSQLTQVHTVVRQLTGYDCSPDLDYVLSSWDFTHLDVAAFGFGFKGTFAERLLRNNLPDAANPWWEGAFEVRPKTQLFVAQGDPYVILLDIRTDDVLAYIADQGASTAVKIASSLSMFLRMLSTVQVHEAGDTSSEITVAQVKAAIGECDEQFWSEQIGHWAQFR